MVQKWILPTISEVLALSESRANCHAQKAEWTGSSQNGTCVTLPIPTQNANILKRVRAEREWRGAIAAMEQLLRSSIDSTGLSVVDGSAAVKGLVLAGPVPVLSQKVLLSSLQTGIFTTEWLNLSPLKPFQLPPATAKSATENLSSTLEEPEHDAGSVVPLLPGDPLASEKFCLVLTAQFSLVMVLGADINGVPAFMFSFEPEVVEQAWRTLRSRVELTSHHFLVCLLYTSPSPRD